MIAVAREATRLVAKADAYTQTMYLMAALLVIGLICNLLIRPVMARHHMTAATAVAGE